MLLVATASASFAPSTAFSAPLGTRGRGVAMSLLKAEATAASLDNFFSQAEAATGIVCVAVTEPSHFLASNLLASYATSYASSMLYGGPSCAVIECSLASPSAEVDALLAERLKLSADSIELPLCATFSKGSLAKVVAPANLEATLLALGARSASSKDNLASRDFGAPSGGGPSATAVDEIDFTGGAGNAGRPDFVPKFNDAGRTTRGYFPGSNLEENAGDYITREDGDGPVDRSRIVGDGKGPQGGPPGRRDKPPGVP